MSSLQTFTFVFVVMSVLCDLTTRRIPNVLTFGAAIAGIVIHGYLVWHERRGHGGRRLVGRRRAFLPGVRARRHGRRRHEAAGRDRRLARARAAVWVALYSGIAGGVMALFVALFSGYLTKAFTNIW